MIGRKYFNSGTIVLMACLFSTKLISQNLLIKGSVVDSATGRALPDVTVNSGKRAATKTGSAGLFELRAAIGDSISFSFVGYLPQTVAVKNNNLRIAMASASASLENIVVTALGIKRAEKSLGYSAQKLNENVVKDARTTNWVNALSGKVAGLNIQGSGNISEPVSETKLNPSGMPQNPGY